MPKRSDVKRLQKYILSAPKCQQTGDLQNRRIQHQLNYTTNFAHAAYIACSTIIVEQIDQKWIEMQKLNMIKNRRRQLFIRTAIADCEGNRLWKPAV